MLLEEVERSLVVAHIKVEILTSSYQAVILKLMGQMTSQLELVLTGIAGIRTLQFPVEK